MNRIKIWYKYRLAWIGSRVYVWIIKHLPPREKIETMHYMSERMDEIINRCGGGILLDNEARSLILYITMVHMQESAKLYNNNTNNSNGEES